MSDAQIELLRARINEMQGELERAEMIGDADGAIVCERQVSLLRKIIARLEAAEKMREALGNFENDDGSVPATIWEMRRAAIAKAKGGA
jgi:hypothetical protein